MSRNTTVKSMENDPNVHVPAAIRAAAARSDALHKAAYNADEPEEPKEKQKGENQNGGTEGQPQEPAPKSAAAAQAAQPEPDAPPPPPADNWEHKFYSLKGRYEQQERTIRNLQQRLSEMEAQPRNPAPQPKKEPNPELQFKPLTTEERESYGDDFIDVAARAAAERFVPTINNLQQELERVNNTLAETMRSQGASAAQVMNAKMDAELPNWRQINTSQKFLDWLALPDAYSGVTRMTMLREAHSKSDARRVMNFFKGFLADEAATDPANHQPAPQADTKSAPGKPKLEDFAAPGRAKAPAATPAPGQKETISRSQITNFYKLVNSGHYRGNEAEKDRLEQMIFDAEREGRIID